MPEKWKFAGTGETFMSDTATPNLPSRDFERTSQFYLALGFSESRRDKGWDDPEARYADAGVLSLFTGRGGGIRTPDPLLPNLILYVTSTT